MISKSRARRIAEQLNFRTGSEMMTPIIVIDGGDVEVYQTAESAALDMEAVDVLNGEYDIYDCEGTVLEAHAASVDSPVKIRLPANPLKEPIRLRAILRDFIQRVGKWERLIFQ